jgi:hypothetical protein
MNDKQTNKHQALSLETPLHELVSIQVANSCWKHFQLRTLNDLKKRIEDKKLFKVPSVPWLFRFADESPETWVQPGWRKGKLRPYTIGIGPKSWEVFLRSLDELGFEWGKHIVNRVAYKPKR